MTTGVSDTSPAGEEKMVFPVSFAQQRLWLLDQLEPNNPVNNVTIAARLDGELDAQALRLALGEILRRHEPLRTTFAVEAGQPVQVIAPTAQLEMPVVDLTNLPQENREQDLQQTLRAEAAKPFNLASDLMMRARLYRLAPTQHVLALNFHHIATDGWSIGVLFHDLAAIYEAFLRGAQPNLPELPIQYADYSVWQREWMQGPVLEKQLHYWKKQLASTPALLELPLDNPRPPLQSYRGTKLPLQIPPSVTHSLRQLGRQENCTLFMTLLAAFQTLISRHTGQHDIVIGSPLANRTQSEVERLIGCFINMIVLRCDLSGEPTFRELLRRVRKMTLEAFAHSEVPFEKLVDELQLPRDQSFSPVYQIMFILQNTPQPQKDLGPVKMTVFEVNAGTTKNDLSFYLWETTEGGLTGWFEYATDLFTPATIQRLADHFKTLLEAAAATPDERISQIPILSQAENNQLLVEFNPSRLPLPPIDSIHQLIEAKAAMVPNQTAVVWNKQRLSYRQLNARANQLARCLTQHGAAPETLVGVFLERSADLVIALLAILKAGSAYVPLDPIYPKERLAFILDDANAPLILTQKTLASSLPATKANALCIDSLDLDRFPEGNLSLAVKPANLAYVLFTSGSTGRPKGVAIEHRSVIALIEWAKTIYSQKDLDGILFSTSICFDVSVFELFATLSLGGKMIVAENALSLPSLPAANEVTFINTVPSAMAELIRSSSIPPSARIANLAGEALPQTLVDRIYQQSPIQKVHDLYGPTEDTVYSTFTLRPLGGRPTIGRPISNTQAYVLDPHMQPVPLGVAGELHLGGAGLARGYWRRPELTAEKFVPNPFSPQPGERLYKTGDLVRFLPDGSIEYLGRIDHQVKIRGFRIELGEIETLLRTFPGVTQGIVIAHQNGSADKTLAAYVASKQQPAPTAADLRAHLKQKLPDYMLPSAFVVLPELPLTPNGKIDRKALPAPEPPKSDKQFIAPRDGLERQLAHIWENLFNRRPIGIHDNFFQIGGHSLLAVRLFMEVEKVAGKKLPLAALFEAPTIEQLSAILRQNGWEPPWLCVVPIKPTGAQPPFYCVHGVGGNILEYLDLAKYMDADQPFYGIQAIGLSGKHPWHKTVEEMAAHYVKEIRDFQPQGPYYIGGSSFGGLVAFEMAQLFQAQGEEVRLLALFDTHAPGYPQFLPATSLWQNRLDHLRFRFSLHWGNFMAAQGLDRLNYIWVKIKKYSFGRVVRFRRFRHRLKSRIEQFFWPREIVQTRQAGHQAHSNYEAPKKYRGNATLFRATIQPKGIQPHPTLGWTHFIEGQLDIYDTPGHHGSIVRDPRARILAEQLKESLRKAHAIAPLPQTPSSPPPQPEKDNLPSQSNRERHIAGAS